MSSPEGGHESGSERTLGWLERIGVVIEVDADEGNTPTVPRDVIDRYATEWEAGMLEFQRGLQEVIAANPNTIDDFLDKEFSHEPGKTPPSGSNQ